jgi:hypothetical protein
MRGHGGASLAKPSEKGKAYYNKYLKKESENNSEWDKGGGK